MNKHGFFNTVANLLNPRPQDVNGLENSSYFYYEKQLYLKLQSVFVFENMPDTVNIDYLKDNLFRTGSMNIINHNGNIYILNGGFTGIDIYNFPTELITSNAVLGNMRNVIGESGELLYFNRVKDEFISAHSLIKRYSVLLAQCDGTLNTSLMNSRVAQVFWAKNDAELRSLQTMYDKISQGSPAVFLKKDKGLNDNLNTDIFNVKNTFIGMEIMDTKRTIMNEFLTEIGINNANTTKRERLNSDEVNANNNECLALVELWVSTMNKCFERANLLFNTKMSVKLNEKIVKHYQTEMVVDEQ